MKISNILGSEARPSAWPYSVAARHALATTALVLALALAAGCNTLEGAGEDIEEAGEAIEDAARS